MTQWNFSNVVKVDILEGMASYIKEGELSFDLISVDRKAISLFHRGKHLASCKIAGDIINLYLAKEGSVKIEIY